MAPSSGTLCGAATVLVVRDVLRSVEAYRDVLGFRVEFTYGEPTFYAGVERDAVVIHLQAASEPQRQPGHGAVNIFVTDVDGLYQELKGARSTDAERAQGLPVRHARLRCARPRWQPPLIGMTSTSAPGQT